MERLTQSGAKEAKQDVTIKQALEKLTEYEDLEEQGKLIKLPCRVGDKLYVINSKEEILELTVKNFSYYAYSIPRLEIYFEDASGFESCLFDGTLNEGVFCTQEEAEKALQERENNKKYAWDDILA